MKKIEELNNWCCEHGKKLNMLANSGCLNDCAFQTFHDNLIAHQKADCFNGSSVGYPAPCHKYLCSMGKLEAMTHFMQSNWVRPEEIHMYEKYFDEIKLATRMHTHPRMVVAAYCRGRFKGNLLDITEPSYSKLFKGYVIDNTLIPDAWSGYVSSCNKECEQCNICYNALKGSLIKYNKN